MSRGQDLNVAQSTALDSSYRTTGPLSFRRCASVSPSLGREHFRLLAPQTRCRAPWATRFFCKFS